MRGSWFGSEVLIWMGCLRKSSVQGESLEGSAAQRVKCQTQTETQRRGGAGGGSGGGTRLLESSFPAVPRGMLLERGKF